MGLPEDSPSCPLSGSTRALPLNRPSRPASYPASFTLETVGVLYLTPFDIVGTLDTIAVRAQTTSAWSSTSSAPLSLHFQRHVHLHRRRCPGELQLLMCSAFALAKNASPGASLSAGGGNGDVSGDWCGAECGGSSAGGSCDESGSGNRSGMVDGFSDMAEAQGAHRAKAEAMNLLRGTAVTPPVAGAAAGEAIKLERSITVTGAAAPPLAPTHEPAAEALGADYDADTRGATEAQQRRRWECGRQDKQLG